MTKPPAAVCCFTGNATLPKKNSWHKNCFIYRRGHQVTTGGEKTERRVVMGLILLVVLVLVMLSVLPTWGYSRQWGYGPTGGLGIILLIVIVLVLMGVIPGRF